MRNSKMRIVLLVLSIILGISTFTAVNADEKESKVTVTIIQDSSIESSTSDTEQETQTSNTQLKDKENHNKLPQTNEGINPFYSIVGIILFIIAIVGILYNKKRNGEQYNEKN
ncbi:LPXTG cell wall anchor domain-containing protein [Enterococcus sp. AZ179]|uniref:LPXTG cell wall anchor domain-containing protein n=1 Tax=Enterococcus sp. AZ179 TaxID=2774680 RepID=UPI003D2D2EC8